MSAPAAATDQETPEQGLKEAEATLEKVFRLGDLQTAEALVLALPESDLKVEFSGRLALLNGDYTAAFDHFSLQIELHDRPADYSRLGYIYQRTKREDLAASCYRAAIKLSGEREPLSDYARQFCVANMGLLMNRQGQKETAAKLLESVEKSRISVQGLLAAIRQASETETEPEFSPSELYRYLFLHPEDDGAKPAGFDWLKWFGLPLVLLVFMGGLLLMQVISDLRLAELEDALTEFDHDESGSRSHEMLSRFLFIKKRFGNESGSESEYLDEARLMASDSALPGASERKISFGILEKPALVLVNAIGSLTGSSRLESPTNDRGRKMVELGYYFERKRQYANAEKVYNAALTHYRDDPKKEAYLHLHRGYSRALKGDRAGALQDFQKARSLDGNGDIAMTARSLQRFVEDMDNKLEKVDQEKDSVRKGVKYFRLADYNRAIGTFNKVEKDNPRNQELTFYRGRSFEEQGDQKKAIENYRRTIAINPGSRYARDANRRLYMIGAFYNGDQKLVKEAEKTAKVNDAEFLKKTSKVKTAVDKKSLNGIVADGNTLRTLAYVNSTNSIIASSSSQTAPGGLPGSSGPLSNSLKIQDDLVVDGKQNLKDDELELAHQLKKSGPAEKITVYNDIPVRRRKIRIKSNLEDTKTTDKKPEDTKTGKDVKTKEVKTDVTVAENKTVLKKEIKTITKDRENEDAETSILNPKELEDPTLSRETREKLLKNKSIIRIFTNDGLIFVGTVIRENDYNITINTVIGPFTIEKSNIAMQVRARKKEALK